jgi:hypothetical protein
MGGRSEGRKTEEEEKFKEEGSLKGGLQGESQRGGCLKLNTEEMKD